jgi:hypothetical protein
MIISGVAGIAYAQDLCDHPFADSCHFPIVCCEVPIEDCPWQWDGLGIVYLVSYFKGGNQPLMFSPHDVNCNCVVNGADILYYVNFLKGLGPAPKCCFYICRIHEITAVVGDRVWLDADGDGIQDVSEGGAGGVTVKLIDYDGVPDTIATVTTDSGGYYAFDSLAEGNYKVLVVPPDGYLFSPRNQGANDSLDSDVFVFSGQTANISMAEGEIDLTVDAGMYPPARPGAIGDFVWLDANMDGIQDADEPGLAFLEVRLMDCADSSFVASQLTDSSGHYLFENLAPGDYFLELTLLGSFAFSPIDQGSDDCLDNDVNPSVGWTFCTTLEAGETDMCLDAGMYRQSRETALIGDRVWNDRNANGIQDIGESGVPNVTVHLTDCNDPPNILATDTTDGGGWYYAFDSLAAGRYDVQFILPDSFRFSPRDQGLSDSLDSDVFPETGLTPCIEVVAGQIAMYWDAGMIWTGAPPDSGCTRGKGFWKNHCGFGPQPDFVSQYLPIWLGESEDGPGILVDSARVAYDILTQQVYGEPFNGVTRLYAQLLAAKLNIASGAYGSVIDEVLTHADLFLGAFSWEDWDELSPERRRQVLEWKDTLESYNEGDIGPGSCEDDPFIE